MIALLQHLAIIENENAKCECEMRKETSRTESSLMIDGLCPSDRVRLGRALNVEDGLLRAKKSQGCWQCESDQLESRVAARARTHYSDQSRTQGFASSHLAV